MATCKECLHYELCQHNTYKEAQYFGKDKEVYITIKNRISCRFFTPKSDYVKRERGEWIFSCTYNHTNYYRCSVCGYMYPIFTNTHFCQHCSADMRKGDNNA